MDALPDWLVPLGELGFPALVAIYLLIRFEKRIDLLTKAIQDLQRSTPKNQ